MIITITIKHVKVNVEDIRSGVINKKNKISIQDVENLAMMLSRSSFSSSSAQERKILPIITNGLRISRKSYVAKKVNMIKT